MRKILITLLTGLLMLVGLASASATGGSDAPTPYTVTTEGIKLPEGDVFQANGHVNVRFYAPEGGEPNLQQVGIHFDPNNGHPGGQWIGKSFIPWSAFGIAEGSEIRWVQVHGYNQHFGEGGQKPIPVTPKPEPQSEDRVRKELGEWEETPMCETGEIRKVLWEYEVAERREQTVTWNSDTQSWDVIWGEWIVVSREQSKQVGSVTVRMTDEQIEACGLPPTGAPLVGAGIAALALMGGGGALAFRKRR